MIDLLPSSEINAASDLEPEQIWQNLLRRSAA